MNDEDKRLEDARKARANQLTANTLVNGFFASGPVRITYNGIDLGTFTPEPPCKTSDSR